MKILMAEDDPISRTFLHTSLVKWGYEVSVAVNGGEAWSMLKADHGIAIAILDWMMPELDGLEVCRLLHEEPTAEPVYTIILTAKSQTADIVTGLDAGADDYLTKPFNRAELHARIKAGVRVIELRKSLAMRVEQLEKALSQVRQLQGLLPICSYCKKIRDDSNYWQQVDSYISRHAPFQFSHGVCPSCYESHVKPELENLTKLK